MPAGRGIASATPRSYFGDAVIIAFLVTQAIDGVFTYLGIATYGAQIEANPIIGWYVGAVGPSLALIGAKVFAAICAVTLHTTGRHRILGLLTLGYLALAIWPWTQVLSTN